MCIAIICDTAKPDLTLLVKAERTNKDGGGIAWIENKFLMVKKGLTAIEVNTILQRAELPCFIHFRIATVGGKIDTLCHPFAIRKDGKNLMEGKAESVLMHNGHWREWQDSLRSSVIRGSRILAKGPWSDSRAMAYLVAHHGEGILETIVGEKIAVMDQKGAIRYYGFWHEKDGMLFSNQSLLSTKAVMVDYQLPAKCESFPTVPVVSPTQPLSKKAKKREEKLQRLAAQHNISQCSKAVFNCRLCSYKLDRPWYPAVSSKDDPLATMKHDFWECEKTMIDCPQCTDELKRNPRLWDEVDKPGTLPVQHDFSGSKSFISLADAQKEYYNSQSVKQDNEIIKELERTQKEGSLNKSGME